MPPIDSVANSGFIPEIFLATALGRLKSYLTLQRTVTMDRDLPTGETFDVGKVLHLPKRGTLVVNQKTETGQYQIQNPQSSTVDLTLNHHPEVSFALTSEAIAFQNQDVTQGYINDAIIALAEDVDSALFNGYLLVSAANTITNAGTITEPNILSARKILRDNKIIPTARAYGVVSTAQEAAILQLPNTVRYDALGVSNNVTNATVGDGAVTMPGAIGRIYGFEVCPSQLVPTVAGNSNALQTVTLTGGPTGGNYTLAYGGQTTVPIPYNAPAQSVPSTGINAVLSVQSALEAVIGKGLVFVSGAAGGPYTVAILNSNAVAPSALTLSSNNLTGGAAPNVTIAQVAQQTGAKNLFYTQDFLLMASRALPLPAPGTGAVGTVMQDEDTGITMRLVKSWNPQIGSEQVSLDLLYGFTAMRSEHGVLVQTS
jgi:hypothetical protein